jgi:hypothetical protein
LRHPTPFSIILSLLLGGLLAGCGVSFSDDFDGTELFKAIRLDGERAVEAELVVTVTVSQGYVVPVRIACMYEDGFRLTDDQLKMDFSERAIVVGDEVLDPAPKGTHPDDEREEQDVSFRFRVREPGDYFLACFTPHAPDNGLSLSFEIPPPVARRRPNTSSLPHDVSW